MTVAGFRVEGEWFVPPPDTARFGKGNDQADLPVFLRPSKSISR